MIPGGTHLVVEFMGCTPNNLNSMNYVIYCLLRAAHAADCVVLSINKHKFEPNGVSVLLFLAESHLSIHTWPENGYAAIDLFTCGTSAKPAVALETLVSLLKPSRIIAKTIERGEDHQKFIGD